MNFNRVVLVGNLTREPEIKYLPSGTTICNFGIAINHRYKSGEENKEEVCFLNISAFAKMAENCGKYLNKGSSVLVEGRIRQRRWDTDDGKKMSVHEIVASNVQFLSPKNKEDKIKPEEQDDIPF